MEMHSHQTEGIIDPISDHIIISDIENDNQKVVKGIIRISQDRTTEGIRPRWAKIIKVGPDQKDVSAGQWILIEHGQWTRGVLINDITYRKANSNGILLVSDTKPEGV